VKAAEHSERLLRGLAEKQPDAYTASWGISLGNLGVKRAKEGLNAVERAERLWRGLAERQPDAYTATWVSSLSNLADILVAIGRFGEALDLAKVALQHMNALAQRYPRVYRPWSGFANRVAAEALFGLGSLEEAVAEAQRSADIWTEVAKDRQNYESTQVAKTF